MKREKIKIRDKESFFIDKVLEQVKDRKKKEKLLKKSKGGDKNE